MCIGTSVDFGSGTPRLRAATAVHHGNGLFIPLRHSPPVRPPFLLLLVFLPWLAGCADWGEPTGIAAGANLASVVVFQRSVPDILFSLISGRNCSVVRLDEGRTYCEAPWEPRPQPFCTRSLGVVDCWADPARLPAPYHEVGDTPAPLPVQEEWRRARWPKQVNVGL